MCLHFLAIFLVLYTINYSLYDQPPPGIIEVNLLRNKKEENSQLSTDDEYSEISNSDNNNISELNELDITNNKNYGQISNTKEIYNQTKYSQSIDGSNSEKPSMSPHKVELSIIKPFKLIKRPKVESLQIDEFAFMVRPNERMIGIENFVISEIERLNSKYNNISAGGEHTEGESSIQNYKYNDFGHFSFPGYIKDEIFSKEIYLRTVPYARYTPLFIEVRSSSYNAALHGIYKREDSMQLSKNDQRFPWYAEPINRPIYRRVYPEPSLYIFFLNFPIEKWCIGDTWPINNPKISVGQIYAEIIGRPYSPVFTRGWYVEPRKFSAHDIVPFVELDPSTPLRNPLPVKIPTEMESKRVLVFDKDLIVDEARPFAFIPIESVILEHIPLVESPDQLQVFPGCPNPHISKFSGLSKYKTPICIPPPRGTLDISINGANGYFSNALYSWEGFFKSRPYFVQRGPLRNEEVSLQSSIVEYSGNSQYLWSHVSESNDISWIISRQLGNTNPSQILAIWKRPSTSRVKSDVDWPAERGIELEPDGWSFLKPPFKKKYVHNIPNSNFVEEKVFLRVNGLRPKHVKMVVNGGTDDINGDYFHLGEYLGFPFFRQRRNKRKSRPGYVLYRGFVINKLKDAWVIGTTLGSIHGIKAYAIDYVHNSHSNEFEEKSGFHYFGGTRWPHQLQIRSWRIWVPTDETINVNIYSNELIGENAEEVSKSIEFSWKTFESLYITMEYLNPALLFKQHLSPVIREERSGLKQEVLDINSDPKSLDLSKVATNSFIKEIDQVMNNSHQENDHFNSSALMYETISSKNEDDRVIFIENEKKENNGNNNKILGTLCVLGSIIIGIFIWIFFKGLFNRKNSQYDQEKILGHPNGVLHPSVNFK
ncbi:putative transmembrane domain-containing protein [Cryptosporidium canis]|uniref:Transmembrane domain-containing protein n=1 Tax=Cryptosporidium canis TaxID=195482 RepID=A0A9D5DKQ9_9CRYT|nr:putative transmembrane domain-containing protein [Cryptosporidium canis]